MYVQAQPAPKFVPRPDKHNDVEVRVLLDEAGEVAELGDGRCVSC